MLHNSHVYLACLAAITRLAYASCTWETLSWNDQGGGAHYRTMLTIVQCPDVDYSLARSPCATPCCRKMHVSEGFELRWEVAAF